MALVCLQLGYFLPQVLNNGLADLEIVNRFNASAETDEHLSFRQRLWFLLLLLLRLIRRLFNGQFLLKDLIESRGFMNGELFRLGLLSDHSRSIDQFAPWMLFERVSRRREGNGSVQNINLSLRDLMKLALPVENLDWMGPRYYKLRERRAYLAWTLTPA